MIGLEGAVPVGRTLAAGLIGDPVAHSLSPVIHNAAYAALGLDWCYKAFLVHDGDVGRALSSAAARGLRGLSVTTPHKVAAATACDERSAAVERIGAANTVVFSGGRTRAETTDGPGLLDDLAATWRFNPAGQVCAVVGAGATARAIVAALADAGAAEVLVIDRTEAHAEAAAALAGPAGRVAGPATSPGPRSSSRRPRSGSPGTRPASMAAGRRSPTTWARSSSPSTSSTRPPSRSFSPWRAPRGPACATASACSCTRRPTRWSSSPAAPRRSG